MSRAYREYVNSKEFEQQEVKEIIDWHELNAVIKPTADTQKSQHIESPNLGKTPITQGK